VKWWKALNPSDKELLEGEKKTLRLRIALTLQLEELKNQLERLEQKVTEQERTDG
jgi:hypothetical protein